MAVLMPHLSPLAQALRWRRDPHRVIEQDFADVYWVSPGTRVALNPRIVAKILSAPEHQFGEMFTFGTTNAEADSFSRCRRTIVRFSAQLVSDDNGRIANAVASEIDMLSGDSFELVHGLTQISAGVALRLLAGPDSLCLRQTLVDLATMAQVGDHGTGDKSRRGARNRDRREWLTTQLTDGLNDHYLSSPEFLYHRLRATNEIARQSAMTISLIGMAANTAAVAAWSLYLQRLRRLKTGDGLVAEALVTAPPVWLVARRSMTDQTIAGHSFNRGDLVLCPLQRLGEPDTKSTSTVAALRTHTGPSSAFGRGRLACPGASLGRLTSMTLASTASQHASVKNLESLKRRTIRHARVYAPYGPTIEFGRIAE